MPFFTVRGDITTIPADAIVNAANPTLLGGGGVDGAIHKAAGPGLLQECKGLGGCPVGEAKATGGYDLPCQYVIHTPGPVWQGGDRGEAALLRACYTNSLALAARLGCERVTFPLISAGVYGYPRKEALQVAAGAIESFLDGHDDMTVTIVLFDRDSFAAGRELYPDIAQYIDDRYARAHGDAENQIRRRKALGGLSAFEVASTPVLPEADRDASEAVGAAKPKKPVKKKQAPTVRESVFLQEVAAPDLPPGLGDALALRDEGFSAMLLRKIDEAGMTDAQCYKAANISRKLFSKIRTDSEYRPSKATTLAFAVALRLSPAQTDELLRKAGFALSPANKFDIIVEYFISRGLYDIYAINEALFAFDQPLLGS